MIFEGPVEFVIYQVTTSLAWLFVTWLTKEPKVPPKFHNGLNHQIATLTTWQGGDDQFYLMRTQVLTRHKEYGYPIDTRVLWDEESPHPVPIELSDEDKQVKVAVTEQQVINSYLPQSEFRGTTI